MAELVDALPTPELGDFLVSECELLTYATSSCKVPKLTAASLLDLSSADWVYKVTHRALFLDEVQQLWSHMRNGSASTVDPAWLALFFMVCSTCL